MLRVFAAPKCLTLLSPKGDARRDVKWGGSTRRRARGAETEAASGAEAAGIGRMPAYPPNDALTRKNASFGGFEAAWRPRQLREAFCTESAFIGIRQPVGAAVARPLSSLRSRAEVWSRPIRRGIYGSAEPARCARHVLCPSHVFVRAGEFSGLR